MNEHFSTRLNLLRETKNYSQAELAELLDTSRISISHYLRGNRVPDIDMLLKICNLFSVTSDYLLGLSDDPKPVPTATDELGLDYPAIEKLLSLKSCGDTSFVGVSLSKFITSYDFINILAVIHVIRTNMDIFNYRDLQNVDNIPKHLISDTWKYGYSLVPQIDLWFILKSEAKWYLEESLDAMIQDRDGCSVTPNRSPTNSCPPSTPAPLVMLNSLLGSIAQNNDNTSNTPTENP